MSGSTALTTRSTAAPAGSADPASKDLVFNVGQWVHLDNRIESLQKQLTDARNLRNTFEEKILRYLDVTRTPGLQITGAVLKPATRPKQTDLSWTFLEAQLHEFYKGRGRPDETAAILEFLQSRRDTKHVTFLKKSVA